MPSASAISLQDAPPRAISIALPRTSPPQGSNLAPRDLCRGLAAAAAQRRRVLPGTPDILAVFPTSPVSLSMPRALSFESWLYIRTPDRTERSNYSSTYPVMFGIA